MSPDGAPSVIKLVPKDAGAERELLLPQELEGTPNVIPILATGEFEDDWVLAMPRADLSLRDYMRDRGPMEPSEATTVLKDVLEALAALQGRVVHRDLKPENVLRLNGTWCLADFGIARYAEQTTAPDTRKFAMTAAYAAPEQWRFEQATWATDVYALGVVAYEMLSGECPFLGPAVEDFREQHLEQPAPPLENLPTALATIVASCLRKAAGARPSPADLLARLRETALPASQAAARLQRANFAAEQQAAEKDAAAEAARTGAERTEELYKAAEAALRPVYDELRAQLLKHVPRATPSGGREWPFELNGARLTWVSLKDAREADWGQYRPAFEVIAHAGLELRVSPRDPYPNYHGRSHSLWYCDAQEAGAFRWYETAFAPKWRSADLTPSMLAPDYSAGRALSRVVLPKDGKHDRY